VLLYEQHLVLPDDQQGAGSQRVVVCTRCGGAFTDTSIPQREYDALYENRSRYAAGPAAPVDADRDVARFEEVAALLAEAVPNRLARIVDIGCAGGEMLAALAGRGYVHLTGIDPAPACVERTASLPGVRANRGSLSNLPAPEQPWDLVILSHVLEHVRDLKGALTLLRPFVAPAGVLYVEVPDASRYVDFAWSPFQDFNSEHINHFSLQTLENLLAVCGFRTLARATKEILSAPGMPYPALYCLARREEGHGPIRRDDELRSSLESYITRSAAILGEIDRCLSARIGPDEPVIVWGTGELTAKLLAQTVLGRARIVAFVDSNPVNQGRILCGLPVIAPEALSRDDAAVIVASSILHYDSIARAVRSLGLTNPVLRLPDPRASQAASMQ
jgi:2-polyprenyl-3-methyl-5-hydroxy-6-metoxy-1,4-benzoquinol methylase